MQRLPLEGGKFIVIEGLDGSGSTTQTELLALWLESKGHRVYTTREPSDGPVAKWLRQTLVGRVHFEERTLALLFLADRLDHVGGPTGFLHLLNRDPRAIVISDRYHLSSFAYQTRDPRISFDWLWDIHAYVPRPHVTFFIDTPPWLCLERLAFSRGFHYEKYETSLAELEKTRDRYLKAIEYLQNRGDYIMIVDGDDTELEIHRKVRYRLEQFLESAYDIERLTQKEPLIAEAVHALQSRGLQVIGVREMGQGIQLKVIHPKEKRTVVVNFYRRGGRWSTITYGGDPGSQREWVKEALRPVEQRYFQKQAKLPLFPEDFL